MAKIYKRLWWDEVFIVENNPIFCYIIGRLGREWNENMNKLKNLEPSCVYRFFEEICRIPHGSYHIDEISDYLKRFALERGLKCIQDEAKNIIIFKPASKGYEQEDTLIIQGHMDMVAVKDSDSDKDMEKEGLDLCHDDKYIWADKTSLGADDGIAIAYALAILDSDEIMHPDLEVVITVDEEVGMDGALALDASVLKGTKLLNIDSEEDGILTVGCAGGQRIEMEMKIDYEEAEGNIYRILLEGLLGGHSGVMIHKGRANANVLMGRLLYHLQDEVSMWLIEAKGGSKGNAIADFAEAKVLVPAEEEALFLERIKVWNSIFVHEFEGKETGLSLRAEKEVFSKTKVCTANSAKRCAELLIAVPDGVIAYNAVYPELVETSLNIGIMSLKDGVLKTIYELRSSMRSAATALCDKVVTIGKMAGATVTEGMSYPEWEYKSDSRLQTIMKDIFKDMFGKEPIISIVHAGLECGVFSEKIKGLDAVSFGPDMLDIHTTKERLSIESTERMWKFLLAVLSYKKAG